MTVTIGIAQVERSGWASDERVLLTTIDRQRRLLVTDALGKTRRK
jgi:hypothetical protein